MAGNNKKKAAKKKKPVWEPKKGTPSRFPKGVSGNPNGRPKGSKNKFSVAELADSIKRVEKKKHKKFMDMWIESAWGDATAMGKIAEFMIPKLRSIEGLVGTFDASMNDEQAKAIQDKLKQRFGNGK